MQFRAIVTDLDGTVLDSPEEKIVSARLAAAVKRVEDHDIKVCAATGRAQTFAMPVIESMGLTHPAIVSGGTRIIDPTSGKELWSCYLPKDSVEELMQILSITDYGYLWNDYAEGDYLDGGWAINRFDSYDSTYFIEACFVPESEVPAFVESLNAIDDVAVAVVVAQRPGMKDIHITNKAATKEHAVYELEKILDVPKSEMIGIGDGHNDMHLFAATGYNVAMGNAVPELKAVADEVIDSVTEDGFAKYLENLAMKEEKKL